VTRQCWIDVGDGVPIVRQCELAGVSRATVSAHRRSPPEDATDLLLCGLLDEIYTRRPFYGSRRMVVELRTQGHQVNRKCVQRLMRGMGLAAIAPGPHTSRPHPQHKVYPYLLRGVAVTRPNQVWSTDITYIRLARGFCYLVAIMDWYSRKVLSWRLSNTMEASFCIDCLGGLCRCTGHPRSSTATRTLSSRPSRSSACSSARVTISMDGRGRAFDNAEEEPENPDYPADPAFREQWSPRGVLRSTAGGEIEGTGPLTSERMKTIDEEFLAATFDFIERKEAEGTPWFVWFNTTRMHIFTHLKDESRSATGLGIHADGMVEHDGHVGQLLAKLDELGVTDNTIVIYTTDNGAEKYSWPDGGTSPFRGEKATTWEGGFRVPMMVRWPGRIAPGQINNEIISLEDWVPTLMAAVGVPDVKERLLEGHTAGDMTYKVHLDGYNLLPALTGESEEWPRNEFFCWVDDGTLGAVRYGRFKAHFSTQDHHGMDAWFFAQTPRKAPLLIDLRGDPFEVAPFESSFYGDWVQRLGEPAHVRRRPDDRDRPAVHGDLPELSAAAGERQLHAEAVRSEVPQSSARSAGRSERGFSLSARSGR